MSPYHERGPERKLTEVNTLQDAFLRAQIPEDDIWLCDAQRKERGQKRKEAPYGTWSWSEHQPARAEHSTQCVTEPELDEHQEEVTAPDVEDSRKTTPHGDGKLPLWRGFTLTPGTIGLIVVWIFLALQLSQIGDESINPHTEIASNASSPMHSLECASANFPRFLTCSYEFLFLEPDYIVTQRKDVISWSDPDARGFGILTTIYRLLTTEVTTRMRLISLLFWLAAFSFILNHGLKVLQWRGTVVLIQVLFIPISLAFIVLNLAVNALAVNFGQVWKSKSFFFEGVDEFLRSVLKSLHYVRRRLCEAYSSVTLPLTIQLGDGVRRFELILKRTLGDARVWIAALSVIAIVGWVQKEQERQVWIAGIKRSRWSSDKTGYVAIF